MTQLRIGPDARRLEAGLRLAEVLDFEESAQSIQYRIINRGLDQAVEDLNKRWGTHLSVGPYVLYSPARERYWSDDHGWLVDPVAANGYSERDLRVLKAHKVCGAPDAEFRALDLRELLQPA